MSPFVRRGDIIHCINTSLTGLRGKQEIQTKVKKKIKNSKIPVGSLRHAWSLFSQLQIIVQLKNMSKIVRKSEELVQNDACSKFLLWCHGRY
jgi:hypothetical protein